MLGYRRDELLSLAIGALTPDDNRENVLEGWRGFQERGAYSGEYRLERKDGSRFDTEFRAVANILPGVHLAVVRDITDRKRMEADREALLGHLVHLQEEERSAIARELHDEVGQLLT